MELLILGATGLTGQHLLKKALEASHQVTVLVRDPAKLIVAHKNLTILTGDVLDKLTLTNALRGKDVVLSAIGKGKSLKAADLMTNAVNNLILCMQTTHVNRVVMLSAFGVGATIGQANFIQRLIFTTLLKSIFSDKTKADAMLQYSPFNYTLVYPVVLTNGPGTGHYKAGETFAMKGMPKISRADVADFMLKQVTDNTYIKKTVILMS